MRKIFIVYGHYDDASFNAAIKKTFIEKAKEDWKNGLFPKIPGDDKEFIPLI